MKDVQDGEPESLTQFDLRFWEEYRESLMAEVRALQRRIKAIERGVRLPRIDTGREKKYTGGN